MHIMFLRDFCCIQRHLSLSSAKAITLALINSRVDYCNSLLNNIAKEYIYMPTTTELTRVVLEITPFLPLLSQLCVLCGCANHLEATPYYD